MPLTLQTIRSRSAQLFSMYRLMLSYSSKEKLPGGLMHQCCSRIAWTKEGFNTLLTRSKSVKLTAQSARVWLQLNIWQSGGNETACKESLKGNAPGAEWPEVSSSALVYASSRDRQSHASKLSPCVVWLANKESYAFFHKHISHLRSQDALLLQSDRGFWIRQICTCIRFPWFALLSVKDMDPHKASLERDIPPHFLISGRHT